MRRRTAPLPVEPRCGPPRHICVDGCWRPVRGVLEAWVVEGRWWGAPERREYFRLHAGALVVEAFRLEGAWHLSGVED